MHEKEEGNIKNILIFITRWHAIYGGVILEVKNT